MRNLFKALTYSNIFIAFCAWMMTWETQQRFLTPDPKFLLFVFSATLLTYYFHALVNTIYEASSDRHAWNLRHKRPIILLTLMTFLLTLFSAWPFRHQYWPMAGVAIATFLYSAPNIPLKPFTSLRKIAFGKTVYLALVWTYVTTFLPLLVSHGEMDEKFWLFALHRFLLIYPICILFDKRDLHDDKEKGVRTLATMNDEQTLKVAYYGSLILSAACAAAYTSSPVNILLIPLLILLFIYPRRGRERSDVFYFLILDGLMMLSACIHALIVFVF